MDALIAEGPVDLILPDTSLGVSLLAAGLEGKRVVQLDEGGEYGGGISGSESFETSEGKFIVDNWPVLLYARGPLADLLLELKLTEYVEFMACDRISLWLSAGCVITLPVRKEQVMMEPSLTLSEKRRLFKTMKSLLETLDIVGDVSSETTPHTTTTPHNLNTPHTTLASYLKSQGVDEHSRVFQLIAFVACRCESLQAVNEMPLSGAIESLHALHASLQHFSGQGGGPFVMCLWGASELAQAAARRAALNGCVQVMSREDCLRAQRDLSSKQVMMRVTSEAESCKRLWRWCFGVKGSWIGGGCELLTIPPRCELNPRSEAALNILQLPPTSQCCPPGTVMIQAWSVDDLSGVLEAIIPADSIIFQRKWTCTQQQYGTRLLGHPFVPANHAHETEFTMSLREEKKGIE